MAKEPSVKLTSPSILTINGGSSSIKFALFEEGDQLRQILEGAIERIGLREPTMQVRGLNREDNFSRHVTAPDYTAAVGVLIDWIEELDESERDCRDRASRCSWRATVQHAAANQCGYD